MRAKKIFIIGITMSLILLSSLISKISAITAIIRGTLPSTVSEASGLDFTGDSDFWTHNDGGSNKIYRISKSGSLKQTLTISGAANTDWEDLTHNSTRSRMYIGDFGNNNFDRRNLKIYKISYPTSSTTSITASSINFSYPDQNKFPSKWKNFDVEGFFHVNGKLCLFTKGEGSAIGYTKLYTVPDDAGTYVATLVDSFYVNSRITGASISPDGLTAVLISNTNIFLFQDFAGSNIFSGQRTKISISGSWTQKEGVSYYSNSVIYIVDEGSPGSNKIYSVDLTSYISHLRLSSPIEEETLIEEKPTVSVFPNPANSFVFIQTGEVYDHVELMISDLSGVIISRMVFDNPDEKIRLETDALKPGIYTLRIVGDNRKEMSTRLSIMNH